ncbi:MAG: beta-phosphoglucomutase [Lentimicrobiaceae bacterium]|nr:beta-phosphoglucomutase [Lentimicrobiaceae bacterium]
MKACLFDLDGVIVDTAKYHYLAWKRLAHELGFDFTEHDNERLKGVSRMTSLEILLGIGGKTLCEKSKEACAARKNEWYVEYIMQMTPDEILPGVIGFLEYLKQNNIKIALGSASKNARTILEKISMMQYFDAIIDGNKVTKAKPNPEIFLKGAAELGIPPAECVVFEDAGAGIQAALNAGMKVVGIGLPENLGHAHLVVPGFDEVSVEKIKKMIKE